MPTHAMINATHDPALRSWIDSANDGVTDFPVQNLPLGRFRRAGSTEPWRIGVAIGDQVLDLARARVQGAWSEDLAPLLLPLAAGDLNAFMALGPAAWSRLRAALSAALVQGSAQAARLQSCLLAQADCELALPCRIGDYTDFYSGIHHATTIGKLFRPDNPLLPNYKWVPIGYHGRASSIGVGGRVQRPRGQTLAPGAQEPVFGASAKLDYELEVGAFVGSANALGEPVPIERAEEALFGLVLLNDWSARDLQAWEYQPLGPFLAKSFATSISPWIVSLEALAPFRRAFTRPAGDPPPLPYLDGAFNREAGAIDMVLEVWLQTAAMRTAGQPALRLSQSNLLDAYWTWAQMLTHHASNGCNLQPGDLLGSGTLSGAGEGGSGSMMELAANGSRPLTLPGGEQRSFLHDGDTVTLRAYCERAGAVRIGLGSVSGCIVG